MAHLPKLVPGRKLQETFLWQVLHLELLLKVCRLMTWHLVMLFTEPKNVEGM
ncbi:hypothetical protein D3C78_1748570 [compost metagenome]